MKQQTTAEFLLSLSMQYPASQPEDYMKCLHQSVFGCGHLIADPSTTVDDIKAEAISAPDITPAIEPLNGDYFRLYLSALHQTGLSANTLAKLLVLSTTQPAGTISQLEDKLRVLTTLCEQNHIPFSTDKVKSQIAVWKELGYPACHHSRIYHTTYHPAYRVIHKKYIRFLPLFAAVDQLISDSQPLLIAIEGSSASGKTTLSNILKQVYDCNVFHMDDFFLQPHQRTEQRLAEIGGNVDYERFDTEVMQPLCRQKDVTYQKFDCSSFTLQPPVTVPYKRINFIEGAYSMHPTFAEHYNLSVFLDIDPILQKKRIQKRNIPFLQEKFFNIWIPMEQRYFSATEIKTRCDLIVEVNE